MILKRLFDILLALFAAAVLLIPCLVLFVIIKLTSKGPGLYWSTRIGKDNTHFRMPKFRSMRVDTPELATDKLTNPDQYVTGIGKFMRKTSADEFPQLWSILVGHMSFVGPRPALYNQDDLIEMRTQKGVHVLKPGLTGWAQINGRDNISNQDKVRYDSEYLERRSLWFDIKIIALTGLQAISGSDISH